MNFDNLMQRLEQLDRSLDVRPSSGKRIERTAACRILGHSHQLEPSTRSNRVPSDIEVSACIITLS